MNILQIEFYDEGHIVGTQSVEDTQKNREVAKDCMLFIKGSRDLDYFKKKYNIKAQEYLNIRDDLMAQFEGEQININRVAYDLDSD